MPELPEVETVRRVLAERLVGRRVSAVVVPKVTFYRRPPPKALTGLVDSEFLAARRRGKYLLLDFSGDRTLTGHLGMSGRLFLAPSAAPTQAHERFRMDFGPESMRFVDPRRFGRIACPLPEFGPEPLEAAFDAAHLAREFRKRRAPVKALLLDQAVVAGVGNIYATEALFLAGVRPARAAASLSAAERERLVAAVKRVLTAGIETGGSTLSDEAFLDPLGHPGRAHLAHAVYGRATGTCGHKLVKTRRPMAGRTSVYCLVCQR
ncbi:MAG: bifunctional DNA-formamidopyrimidine glycosylase/DNA-(apurinic or apyrimidinic site) lyase [Elusimicrobia bacterium]|nr:bifunctional DNA-formamidopyrimidine glycosylase/DNA-(apurinic or apyrimidinic site) lyase [Elusimicrobiota bacterium]